MFFIRLYFLISFSVLSISCYSLEKNTLENCNDECLLELAKSKYLENNNQVNDEVLDVYIDSAKKGNGIAKKSLILIYSDSESKFFDLNKAELYLEDLIKNGDYEQACYWGNIIINNRSPLDEENEKKIIDLFNLAASHKENCGYHDLAAYYFNKKNFTLAFDYFQKSAIENEFGNSEFALGLYYQYGTPPVELDYSKAISWYRKAIAKNHTDAMNSLAFMLIEGGKTKREFNEAISLLKKAALLGNTKSAYNLGEIYKEGRAGVTKDKKMSEYWFEKARELE